MQHFKERHLSWGLFEEAGLPSYHNLQTQDCTLHELPTNSKQSCFLQQAPNMAHISNPIFFPHRYQDATNLHQMRQTFRTMKYFDTKSTAHSFDLCSENIMNSMGTKQVTMGV